MIGPYPPPQADPFHMKKIRSHPPRTWDRATVAGQGVQDALVLIQHAWLPASPAPSPPDARQQVRRPRFETAPTQEVERKTLGL